MLDLSRHGGLPDPVADARFYEGVAARRLIAFLIDAVAASLIAAAVVVVFGLATFGVGFVAAAPAAVAVGFIYRALSIARWSATPGMLATGIELRRFDGERFGAAEAVLHTAGFMVAFFFVVPQLASVALMAAGPLGRGLHDLPLGSTAINRPA